MAGAGRLGIAEPGFELAAARLGGLEQAAAFDLVHHAPGKFLERLDIVEAPRPRPLSITQKLPIVCPSLVTSGMPA